MQKSQLVDALQQWTQQNSFYTLQRESHIDVDSQVSVPHEMASHDISVAGSVSAATRKITTTHVAK